ncbi:methionyl-tRNA formyltransferase [Sulfuritortus calidifontis]|uniref:Methionyl-tRNA formyltransferase n=2 Tax=Sulfuritortus calidifontis TaxID=1914471 RepID=A0A4R3JYV4_9PROT|nr:formyltransferase family protein [Sulfuritortus calidifontis]TCS72473.1 methionyl-tRNA formyltransferase [Sulfuritortus calidifontis]
MINVLFMGRKPVAAQALTWLSKRDDVKVTGVITDSHLAVSPTRDVAQRLGISVLSREEMEEQVQSGKLQVDLAFSMLYWQKIRAPLLQACSRGVINFHPAPLPDYKGTAGYNLAILEGLDHWAVSAHYVDQDIDTGALIEVSRFPIDIDYETAQSLERKSQSELFTQFQRVAEQAIRSPRILPTVPNVGGRYVSRQEMEAMKEMRPGDDVLRKIRAFWFPPYDGAYVVINGVKCTLVSPQILHSLADSTVSSLFTRSTTEENGSANVAARCDAG